MFLDPCCIVSDKNIESETASLALKVFLHFIEGGVGGMFWCLISRTFVGIYH